MITLLILPGKVFAKVLEIRLLPLVEAWMQEEQYTFHPGHETLDQLFIFSRIFDGGWE